MSPMKTMESVLGLRPNKAEIKSSALKVEQAGKRVDLAASEFYRR